MEYFSSVLDTISNWDKEKDAIIHLHLHSAKKRQIESKLILDLIVTTDPSGIFIFCFMSFSK